MESPPPKRMRTFQGIFLYQSDERMKVDFFIGIIKKRKDPNIAITASFKLIPNASFSVFLRIHRLKVSDNIKTVTFSLKEKFPNQTIGFSDHTKGLDASIYARCAGAEIIEKHFTLDNNF